MEQQNNNWDALGIMAAVVNHLRTKKTIKTVQKNNISNRGVIYYKESPIEAFISENEPLGNVCISGGLEHLRYRALIRSAECGLFQGVVPVFFHCGNHELESLISGHFGTQNVTTISQSNPLYDPIYQLSDDDIINLIFETAGKKYEIKAPGRYYLQGLNDYLREKGRLPFLKLYFECPYSQMIDNVNNNESQGTISSVAAQRILQGLVQGEVERSNIERYFSELKREALSLIPNKSQLSRAEGVVKAISNQKIPVIDVLSMGNELLLNILVYEIKTLLLQGKRVMVCMDQLQHSVNEALIELIKQSGSQLSIAISADDVYAAFSGKEELFYATVGKCSKIILLKQSSAYSCQKWSDVIGSYDKQEITGSLGTHANYLRRFDFGRANSINVNIKRENIIRPEEINRLQLNQGIFVSSGSGEVAIAALQ